METQPNQVSDFGEVLAPVSRAGTHGAMRLHNGLLLGIEYFAGVIIVIMQSGGEALENYSLRRASSTLEQLLARAPRIATW